MQWAFKKPLLLLFFFFCIVLATFAITSQLQQREKHVGNTVSFAQKKQTLEELTRDFTTTYHSYQKLSQSPQMSERTAAESLADVVAIARKRKELLLPLFTKSPEEVLKNRLPSIVGKNVPPLLSSLIEKDIEITGKVHVAIEEDPEKDSHTVRYILTTPKGPSYELSFLTGDRKPRGEDTVRLEGIGLDNKVISQNFQVTKVASGPIQQNARLAVIMFNFQDDPSTPNTKEQVAGVAYTNPDSLRALYQENSYGKFTLDPSLGIADVYGPVTIPYSKSPCNFDVWGDSAKTLAAPLGFDPSSYDYVGYVMAYTNACSWAGAGYMPGNSFWVNGGAGRYLFGHEFGHNLGAYHASSLSCRDISGNPIPDYLYGYTPSTCDKSTYGDAYAVMGRTQYGHNDLMRNFYDWYTTPPTVLPVTNSNTYTLYATNQTSAPRTIRIDGHDKQYFLEYRKPFGLYDNFSPSDPVTSGITLRRSELMSQSLTYPKPNQSYLLDTSPTNPSSFDDFVLKNGQTLSIPSTFTLSVLSLTDTQAVIDIHMHLEDVIGSCTRTPPTVTVSPWFNAFFPPYGINYSVQVTNNNNINCPASAFILDPIIPAGYSAYWSLNPHQDSTPLTPGGLKTYSITVTPQTNMTVPFSLLPFQVKVSDGADSNNTAVSNTAYYLSVVLSDTVKPQASITSPSSDITITTEGPCHLDIVGEYSDNTGVYGSELWIDGNSAKFDLYSPPQTSGTVQLPGGWDCSNKWGSHTLFLRVFDVSGNQYTVDSQIRKVTIVQGVPTPTNKPTAYYTVDFTRTPSRGISPLNVLFKLKPDQFYLPTQFAWDFGDGTISTAMEPVHQYRLKAKDPMTKTYTVTLKTNDPFGNTAIKTRKVRVYKDKKTQSEDSHVAGLEE